MGLGAGRRTREVFRGLWLAGWTLSPSTPHGVSCSHCNAHRMFGRWASLKYWTWFLKGAALIDTRVSGSSNGITLPGARSLPHDQGVQRRDELNSSKVSILFCNGPQCPQSPLAIRALLEAGLSADLLAYYRGGVHDWATPAMPTEATS